MKKIISLLLFSFSFSFAIAQNISAYDKQEVMIPMRDGIKLHTVIFTPKNAEGKFPFLIQRTPYGASVPANYNILNNTYIGNMAKEGYIFVNQDIRGKYKSEGKMEIHQPIIHLKQKGTVDESTDTYDAIDWLLKNIPNNNGKAGILGISYPGWLALVGSIDPHPALKAASEQACMSDLFLGDDFHHNGAFRLQYAWEYVTALESDGRTLQPMNYGKEDPY
ncbi:MAG: CocE/NonD family hydrolase, partial [Flavisolibacter sp.]